MLRIYIPECAIVFPSAHCSVTSQHVVDLCKTSKLLVSMFMCLIHCSMTMLEVLAINLVVQRAGRSEIVTLYTLFYIPECAIIFPSEHCSVTSQHVADLCKTSRLLVSICMYFILSSMMLL